MTQCLPENSYETLVIPLSINATIHKELTFSAEANNLPNGVSVYLEDVKTNTLTKINETPYVVTIEEALNGIGRFYLRTSEAVLSTDDIGVLTNVSIYKTTSLNLRIKGLEQQGKATLKMYNTLGKQVFTHLFSAKNVNDVELPNLSAGIYITQIISEKGKYTKKIIME